MMRKWIRDLLALQKSDVRCQQLNERSGLIPREITQLEETLETDRQLIHEAKETVMLAELEIKQVESLIEGQNESKQRLQSQSVMVKKNDEYKALLSEIDTCNKKISDFETQELILMDKVEEMKTKQRNAEKQLADHEANCREEKEELTELQEKLAAEIKKLEEARPELAKVVDRDLLSLYERLLGKGDAPLAEVGSGNCGHCHLKLTPQTVNEARKGHHITCDNCGYLLYYPEG